MSTLEGKMAGKSSTIIYEQIKQDIIRNEYKAHQRVAEDELAKKYGISRTPVREAIRMLEQDGFVCCVKNVGTFIRPISAGEIGDFFDVRGVLEGLTARLAAKKKDAEFIGELKQLAATAIEAHQARDLDAANALDTQFHGAINRRAGNEFAEKYLSSMSDRLMWFLNISNLSRIDYFGSVPFNKMENSHDKIIAAIESGDPELAERYARAHVEEAKQYFIDYCYNKFML